MKKKCFKCGHVKPIQSFYVHKRMADGHLNKCVDCAKKDVSFRYSTPDGRKKVRAYDKARNATEKRKLAKLGYQKITREKRPGAAMARSAVGSAIRHGRLVRLPCEICGNSKSEAHHEDYRRKLDVKWLCFTHHRQAHGQKVGEF